MKALTLSQDHRQLATGGDDGKILLWDAVGGSAEPTARFACEGARITSLAISDDGRWLAAASEAVSGSAQPAVRVWPLLVEDLIAVSDQAAERGLTPVEYERLDIPLMGQAETTTR